jgi:tetrahydromethanopterin S-methyltransferase subunit B
MEEASTPTISTRSVGIRYGLIMGVIGIALFVVFIAADVDIQGPARWLNVLVLAVLIFLAHKYYKDNGDGFMTIGQATGIGFWMCLVSSAISSAFTYIYVKFIDTNFIQQMMDKQREAMEAKGTLSEEQVDQAMNMTSKFMTPEMMLIFGLVFGILFGVLIALIVGIFTQKKNAEAFV